MKTLHYLLIAAIATLFVACSEPTLEKTAKERISSHMKEAIGKNSKYFNIDNYETVFTDDSIYVVQYEVHAENYSGDKATLKMEYYIMWSTLKEPKLVESFYILGDKKSVVDRVIDFSEGKLPDEPQKKAHFIRTIAPALDAFSIHHVKLED